MTEYFAGTGANTLVLTNGGIGQRMLLSPLARQTVAASMIAPNRPMTALELYRRLLDLLRESGLSKQEKIEILDRAVTFIKEEAAVKAIWEPRAPKSKRTRRSS